MQSATLPRVREFGPVEHEWIHPAVQAPVLPDLSDVSSVEIFHVGWACGGLYPVLQVALWRGLPCASPVLDLVRRPDDEPREWLNFSDCMSDIRALGWLGRVDLTSLPY
jgi:hypothetical protein